jgi:hypothetical protein
MNDTTRFTSSPWRHPFADSPNSSFNITCFMLFLGGGGRSCYSTVARGNGELYIRSSLLVGCVTTHIVISWYVTIKSWLLPCMCMAKVINYHVNWIKGGVPGREGPHTIRKNESHQTPHMQVIFSLKKEIEFSLLRVFQPLHIRSQSMKVKEFSSIVVVWADCWMRVYETRSHFFI